MVEAVGLPKLGVSEYGEIVAWEASVGDRVGEGDVLAVIESDKAQAELVAPVDGILLAVYVEAGEEIEIEPGRPIAVIGAPDEEPPPPGTLDAAETAEAGVIEGDEAGEADEGGADEEAATAGADAEPAVDVKASPRAERFAEEHGVDLRGIEGTGPQGSITEDDVREHLDRAGDEDGGGEDGAELTVTETRELSGTRRTIAERLGRSAREKPHVTGTREASVEALERARDRLADEYGVSVSLIDLIVAAVGRTLADFPGFNAHFEDGEHRLIEEVNVGYAVDGPRGLVVPVVEDVPGRPPDDLAAERRRLVDAVLDGDHTAADLEGGTFTVSNVGAVGIDVSYSIINPPEVAILAVGRPKPAPVERGGEVAFETAVTFSLTIDHRALDGADSGAFLDRLAEHVEYPGWVFDEVR